MIGIKPRDINGRDNAYLNLYVGIDYSGAETPTSNIKGLRVYVADNDTEPAEVLPPQHTPSNQRRYWNRVDLAKWLVEFLKENKSTIVGINHGFSFPLAYFERYYVRKDWYYFLDDFRRHWPTHEEKATVELVRQGLIGRGYARQGNPGWKRLTELRSGRPKSVFNFDGQDAPGRAIHAGIPWLRYVRQELGFRVHFWPFNGWEVQVERALVAEVDPTMWRMHFPQAARTSDQHDAYCISAWLSRADQDGSLAGFLKPNLTPTEETVAQVEGWILGVL